MADEGSPDGVRLDRWLWAARMFKSRSLAADACGGGKVDVNGQAAKPHKAVRAGDLVDITTPHGKRQLRVRATSEKRGPAPVARELYEDLTPPPPPPRERPQPVGLRPAGGGRPTKRERRDTDRWRGW
ncbi:MAG: RNA-binding S4 domain-containing protein [Candidatus Rokubacteria bacterium]|nr:RNA-binding S4 domain-containing protein [Candidatus Rokubacteria bacterium]